jgi:hypothetical protein
MKRRLVERTHSIDVGELNREGAFSGRPMRFPFQGLTTGRFKAEFRRANWPRERRSQIIGVTWTRCHLGGMRPWFVCSCGKRTAKLYPGQFEFLGCRKCGNLAYQSQLRGRKSRLRRKAQEIRWRFWDRGRPGVDPLPERSMRMHRKTSVRLLAALEAIERELRGEGGIHRPRRLKNTSY